MRIKIDAEGDRQHFDRLMAALAALVGNCMENRIPLDANVTAERWDAVTVTIVRKQPPGGAARSRLDLTPLRRKIEIRCAECGDRIEVWAGTRSAVCSDWVNRAQRPVTAAEMPF